ncbi:MAG: isoprenyl transferase [Phycisphaerae bacterium]|jgi:undecaprenyl diphosphate synthase
MAPSERALDPLDVLGLPRESLPRHVAIIMDGNGRWARQRGLPRIEGHRNATTAVRAAISTCGRLGIECLTLYSFSVENWKRPEDEVRGLMELYARSLMENRDELVDNRVRVKQIGRREGLPASVVRELETIEQASRNNTGLTLCLALNYGSRAEIAYAVRDIAARVQRGALRPEEIDEAAISNALDTAGLPDPDLVIRTAGEMRLSNFLLWQISYAELHVSPVLWPDFREEHLFEAIRAFAARERRFGDVLDAAQPAAGSPPRT